MSVILPVERVIQYKHEVSFNSIIDLIEEDNLLIRNGHKFNWNHEKIERVVLSLIKNLPLPNVVVTRNKKGKFVVMSGMEILIALHLYSKGLKIHTRSKEMRFKDKEYLETIKELTNGFFTTESSKYEMTYYNPEFDIRKEEPKTMDISYESLEEEFKKRIKYRNTISWTEVCVDTNNEETRKEILDFVQSELDE